jgi:hypothetical protein
VKARNVAKGDWIQVDGKPVQVTAAKRGSKLGRTVIEISYKGGSKSGMLRPGPDTQVSHLAGRRGKT